MSSSLFASSQSSIPVNDDGDDNLDLFSSIFNPKDTTTSKKIGGGLDLYSGTLNKYDYNIVYGLEHIDSTKEIGIDGRYYTAFSNGSRTAEEFTTTVNYGYHPLNKFAGFVAAIAYRNPFRNFNERYSVLAGLKWTLIKTKKSQYSISLAEVYEYSNYTYTTIEGNNNGERFRESFRIKIRQKLFKNVTLLNKTFLKVANNNVNDYSIESMTGLSFKISDKFDIEVNHYYIYDNIPLHITERRLSPFDNVFVISLSLNL